MGVLGRSVAGVEGPLRVRGVRSLASRKVEESVQGELVVVAGIELQVDRLGAGPSLLFLHGEDGVLHSSALVERLAQDFSVVVPHHPGWGESPVDAHVRSAGDIARVYAELVSTLPGPVLVVGVSFGGWVAAELVACRPGNVAGLALISPVGMKFVGVQERQFVDLYVQSFAAVPEVLYGDAARAPQLAGLSDEDFLYLARAQEATARYCWQPYFHNPDLPFWVGAANTPVLMLSGGADRFVYGAQSYYTQYLDAFNATTEHVVVDRAGHRLDEEAPEQVAQAIADFAQGLSWPVSPVPVEMNRV